MKESHLPALLNTSMFCLKRRGFQVEFWPSLDEMIFLYQKSDLWIFNLEMETNDIDTFLQLHKTQVNFVIDKMMMSFKHLLAVGKKECWF